MRYRITALLLALLMISAAFCACTGGSTVKNEGGRLKSNIARIYEREPRKSHFAVDGELIEGDVTGMAYMSTSAFGDNSLAWVSSNLYFVSAKGIDKLGSGIETAEISFDGRIALWQDGSSVYRYCVDDRSITEIMTGVGSVVQFSISPHSSTMLCTAVMADDPAEQYVTTIFDSEGSRELSRSMICFAVSDDAKLMYYYDMETKALTVKQGDEVYPISKNCSASTSYNFTRDLKELTYDDASGTNHLFCLEGKRDTTLGGGFGITEKTDVFSISTVSYYTYINDMDTFRGGLWSAKYTVDNIVSYDVGYINAAGEISWLVKEAVSYEVQPDQSRVVYTDALGRLVSVNSMGGRAKQLATDVNDFELCGGNIYYLSAANTLFMIKGVGKPAKVAGGVADFAVLGDTCAFITSDGGVHYAKLAKVTDVDGISSAVRFDRRVSMLILYTNESVDEEGLKLYDAYLSKDGKSFTPAFTGVQP